MDEIRAGIYRHYKGSLYLLLGLAHDANDINGRTCVVYVGLELNEALTGPRLAIRTYDDFFSLVHNDGSHCEGPVCRRQFDGSMSSCDLKRFTYIGATYNGAR